MISNLKYVLAILLLTIVYSCNKDDLEIKPDQHLLVPNTLEDLQSLLNNANVMNLGPGIQIIAADDYEIFSSAALTSFGSTAERNAYLWKRDFYESSTYMPDWDKAYQQVFYANVVLEGLDNITRMQTNAQQHDYIKGAALFFRSMAFYQLTLQFADVYQANTASAKLGIPLKLTADVNEKLTRATLQQCYDQILHDLQQARDLLGNISEILPLRPSQLAADALLARIYLSMSRYEDAFRHADNCIKQRPQLLDYNILPKASNRPITAQVAMSTEVIFWQLMHDYVYALRTTTSISTAVVNSYHDNDLRKWIYLRNRNNGIYTFKGNYSGDSFTFTGLAMDEVYLIRAECRARLGDIKGSMDDLNFLMKHRWDNKLASPNFQANNEESALLLILAERRKELITRGLRWFDLKRLNLEKRFAITLKRTLESVDYQLPPNDNRYIFPFPHIEIERHGFQQNDR